MQGLNKKRAGDLMLDGMLAEREREGRPLRVGVVGAGSLTRMIAWHLLTPVAGVRLAAVSSRSMERAVELLESCGVPSPAQVSDLEALDRAVDAGRVAASSDWLLLCDAEGIDVVVDVTGAVDFGAAVALRAIDRGKPLVMVNAELDSTLGPILKRRADAAGVVLTNTDGDEPGVAMDLVRYLRMIGLSVVGAGNIKGLLDRSRTPATQAGFAARHEQSPRMVTSFADGTKLAAEATVLANASGLRIGRRGMFGPRCNHVTEVAGRLPHDLLLENGLVDYVLGAAPHTGVWALVHEEQPIKMKHLEFLKMGSGPFYVFFTPYHLPHIQVVSSIARAALLQEATITPLGAPVADVVTVAKRDLKAGDILDGIGGFTSYGMAEDIQAARTEGLLPMGLSQGRRLRKPLPRDRAITYADVEPREGGLADDLRREQEGTFFGEALH